MTQLRVTSYELRVSSPGAPSAAQLETRNSKLETGRCETRRSEAGFTLMEVLVATAIMGIAVTALMTGLSGSLRNIGRAESYERAILLGRAQMNRILIEGPLKPGLYRGAWEDGWRWEAEIRRWNPYPAAERRREEELPPVARIRLNVYWKGTTGEKSVTLETSKYDPRIALP